MRRRIPGWGASLVVVACALAPGGVRAETLRLAVFDPQRVSEETDVGRGVQAELTALRDRKQAEITQQEREISDLQKQLSQQELSLSPDRRSTMERDIQSKLLRLQSARELAGRELQIQVAAAQSRFEDKLLQAVQVFGKEQGYTVVLTRDLVAWADATVDVTDRIIARFNEMFPASQP